MRCLGDIVPKSEVFLVIIDVFGNHGNLNNNPCEYSKNMETRRKRFSLFLRASVIKKIKIVYIRKNVVKLNSSFT